MRAVCSYSAMEKSLSARPDDNFARSSNVTHIDAICPRQRCTRLTRMAFRRSSDRQSISPGRSIRSYQSQLRQLSPSIGRNLFHSTRGLQKRLPHPDEISMGLSVRDVIFENRVPFFGRALRFNAQARVTRSAASMRCNAICQPVPCDPQRRQKPWSRPASRRQRAGPGNARRSRSELARACSPHNQAW